jgi:hypothetical protein
MLSGNVQLTMTHNDKSILIVDDLTVLSTSASINCLFETPNKLTKSMRRIRIGKEIYLNI